MSFTYVRVFEDENQCSDWVRRVQDLEDENAALRVALQDERAARRRTLRRMLTLSHAAQKAKFELTDALRQQT
jgi:hypothetical protein